MRTATQRIRQLFIGILAALSLSVSSVAVCACDHHVLDRQPERSCHATASEKQHDLADIAQTAPSFDESCVCVQKAIKLSVKAEGLKLKKQPSVLSGGFELAKPQFHSAIAFLASDHSLRHWDNPSTGSPSSRGPPVS